MSTRSDCLHRKITFLFSSPQSAQDIQCKKMKQQVNRQSQAGCVVHGPVALSLSKMWNNASWLWFPNSKYFRGFTDPQWRSNLKNKGTRQYAGIAYIHILRSFNDKKRLLSQKANNYNFDNSNLQTEGSICQKLYYYSTFSLSWLKQANKAYLIW